MTVPSLDVRGQVRAVLERYLYALDFEDYDALADCFTIDAALTYDTRPYTFVGGRALAEWVESAHRMHDAQSMHVLGSVAVAQTGLALSVRSLVVANLASLSDSGYSVTVRGINYDDEFMQTADGWKIGRRTHLPLWQFDATGSRLGDIGLVPVGKAE